MWSYTQRMQPLSDLSSRKRTRRRKIACRYGTKEFWNYAKIRLAKFNGSSDETLALHLKKQGDPITKTTTPPKSSFLSLGQK